MLLEPYYSRRTHLRGLTYSPSVHIHLWVQSPLLAGGVDHLLRLCSLALAAALLGNFIASGSVAIAPGEDIPIAASILVEFLFTFALALTVLNVATAKGTKGNSFYGLAIGFMVMCGAFAGGSISGGAFNPAVGIGLSVGAFFEGSGGSWVLLYILAPLAGGALAAYVFKLQGNEDDL